MKIGIIGTRGIPNHYGGFEQFAQILSENLTSFGAEVWVYNSHNHPYKDSKWGEVNIIHKKDPENKIGTVGQFIYDLNCILDCRKRDFDIILQLGYTSSSIWNKLLPKKAIVVTNMDGLEWKRCKYSPFVRKFLKYAEKLAVKSSDFLIADSIAIQSYLKKSYNADSKYISYGANLFNNPDKLFPERYNVKTNEYFLLIARMQADNNVEMIIKGVIDSDVKHPLLIIGNTQNKFGKYLKNKYKPFPNIVFLEAIYDEETLNQLRYNCACYFHGHSAGGTNPSLLEAMAASAFICANDNPFNKAVLECNALYFKSSDDISAILKKQLYNKENRGSFIHNNFKKIEIFHNWAEISDTYYQFFLNLLQIKG